jgi:D-alanine-D-alanine ligase
MFEGMKQIQVGVMFGGRSGEHEVSLMSAQSVLGALDPSRYNITQIGITHEGAWLTGQDVLQAMLDNRVSDLTPATILPDPSHPGLRLIQEAQHGEMLEFLKDLDVIFPVLHGTFGEDGTLQGFLEMADLAYVGAGVLGSALGMDKGVFRDVMAANSIPVLENAVILRRELEKTPEAALNRAEAVARYPLFVKPANLGSSVGITKVRSRSDLLEGLLEAARYDRRVLVQRGVNAREIEVSVLGNDQPEASVPGEVIPSREFYSYESKYIDGTSQLIIPAPIPAKTAERARRLAVKAFKAIDCAGLARVDFLLDKDTSNLYLNEINTMPGFTQISMYPKLWEASGLPYPALVDRLVGLALERKAERDRTERRFLRGG